MRREDRPDPGGRVELDDDLVGLGGGEPEAEPRRMLEDDADLGLGHREALAVRMKNGTPDQRQFSISSRSAAYVSVVESAATPSIPR